MIIVFPVPGLGDLINFHRDPHCRLKPMEPDPLNLSASKSVMKVFVIIVANVVIDIRSGSWFFLIYDPDSAFLGPNPHHCLSLN
jgi:hypothetical protein